TCAHSSASPITSPTASFKSAKPKAKPGVWPEAQKGADSAATSAGDARDPATSTTKDSAEVRKVSEARLFTSGGPLPSAKNPRLTRRSAAAHLFWICHDRLGAVRLLPVGHRDKSWSVGLQEERSRAAGGVTESARRL